MSDDRPKKSPFVTTSRPLEELLPAGGVPRSPVHQRVLRYDREDGFEWALAVWEDPGGTKALHEQVGRLVEATLLSALCRPAAEREIIDEQPRALWLLAFARVPDAARALQAYGFVEATPDPDWLEERMGSLRDEARALGIALPDAPVEVFRASVSHASGMLGDQLRTMQTLMTDRLADEVWGASPGLPSRLLAEYWKRLFSDEITPDPDGLRAVEALLVRHEEGVVRWIPPLLYQAFCDLVGVVTVAAFGEPVQWAVCAPEPDGFAPPPVFRIESGGGVVHVPIGLHVLRWCIMPRLAGEEIPSFTDWLVQQYAKG